MNIKIAIAQINTTLGNTEANLEKHLVFAHDAKNARVDLLVFPELSLTGYGLKDLVPAVAHQPSSLDPIFKPLLETSKDLDLVVGFVDEDNRHRFYIAAAYLSGGEVVHVHRKVYLPTYGLFEESRFYALGNSIRAFDTRFGRMGIAICEDYWHVSPPYVLWVDGADVMIFTSASPGYGLTAEPKLESTQWVELIHQTYANLFTTYVIHANRVGYEDGLFFGGGSTVFDPKGNRLVQGSYFEETMLMAEIDLNKLHRTRVRLPLLRDERTELIQRELDRISK
jgi:predicted amidohydrolase